jgi:hypothetical protein
VLALAAQQKGITSARDNFQVPMKCKNHILLQNMTQQKQLVFPSMRFTETKFFKNPLCTTGMSDLKFIKTHKMVISVVGLHCLGTIKCS